MAQRAVRRVLYKDKRTGLTAKYLRKLLKYDRKTGEFRWRFTYPGRGASRHQRGQIAGTKFKKGWRIEIHGFGYLAHRLAKLYVTGRWPKDQIDHKDWDCWNNRWTNLRDANNSRNQVNRGLRPHNKSGTTGVTDAGCGWLAECSIDGIRVLRKRFKTKKAAIAARRAAVRKHHGEFAVM